MHGTAASSQLWHALGYVEALRAEHTLVLVDARGHGRSDKPRDEDAYAMERMVGDVVAVLDAHGIERAHFLGYSLGGRTCFALGEHAPERVSSLVIGGGSHRPQRGALDRVLYPGFIETIETAGIGAFLDTWSRRLGQRIPSEIRGAFTASDAAALVPYLRRTEREPGHERALVRMAMPVLLFVGEQDRERLDDSLVAALLLPSAELVVVPGANHLTVLSRVDAVLSHVRSSLRGGRRRAAWPGSGFAPAGREPPRERKEVDADEVAVTGACSRAVLSE